LQQPQEKIDQKSLKLITKTMGEWESLGEKNGKYKNPEMGEYTMMVPMVCQTCGEKIPLPEIAAPRPGEAPGAGGDPHAQRRSYKCPKCGKPAFI
jgi:rRNA maturation protein Nop10